LTFTRPSVRRVVHLPLTADSNPALAPLSSAQAATSSNASSSSSSQSQDLIANNDTRASAAVNHLPSTSTSRPSISSRSTIQWDFSLTLQRSTNNLQISAAVLHKVRGVNSNLLRDESLRKRIAKYFVTMQRHHRNINSNQQQAINRKQAMMARRFRVSEAQCRYRCACM